MSPAPPRLQIEVCNRQGGDWNCERAFESPGVFRSGCETLFGTGALKIGECVPDWPVIEGIGAFLLACAGITYFVLDRRQSLSQEELPTASSVAGSVAVPI
jgi:hypothetical protein